MRSALTLFCLMAFGIGGQLKGQTSPLLEKLLSEVQAIAQVTTEFDKDGKAFPFTDLSASQTTSFPTQLVRNKSGLFLLVNGSGVLFRIEKIGDSVKYTRLDNTSGKFHNQGSYLFTFNDSLWSLGGYGYWSFNGMLRQFQPKTGDWEYRNLNEMKPVKVDGDPGNFFFHDLIEDRIYATREYTIKQGLKGGDDVSKGILNRISVLDLKSMDWRTLGNPSEYFTKEVALASDVVSSPWGEFVYRLVGKRTMFLLDFKRNRIMEWKGFEGSHLDRYCKESLVDRSLFFIDSTMYIGSMRLGTLDSMVLKYADFKDTGHPIYLKQGPSSGTWIISASALLLLLVSIYLLVRKSRAKGSSQFPTIHSAEIKVNNEPRTHSLFNPIEWALIELLRDNTSRGLATTVSDVNNILGMARKSFEVQKKGRNQVMNSINGKASAFLSNPTTIIERKRSEEDRRLSLYFINLEIYDKLNEGQIRS